MKMEFHKKASVSDDEDLEVLRLAALQTIKKGTPNTSVQNTGNNMLAGYKMNKFSGSPQGKRGRNFQGGRQRNGQFNHRARNTNLISIPTVPCEDKDDSKKTEETVPKLVLPQDRYCNRNVAEVKPTEPTSKFTRYDNSDDSESESENEEDIKTSPSTSTMKLQRSDSLEALMEELENEIQGDIKPKVQEKAKVKVKKVKKIKTTNESEEKIIEQKENVKSDLIKNSNDVNTVKIEIKKPIENDKIITKKPLIKQLPKFNMNQRNLSSSRQNKNDIHKPNVVYQLPYMPQPTPYQPFVDQNIPYNLPSQPAVPFIPHTLPPNIIHPVNRYDLQRPLSPLSLNAEVLSTVTMAPLSPRSAAFVLQNREIIERRKRSPRRSYSRSPSLSSKSSSGSPPRRASRSPLSRRLSPKHANIKRLSPDSASPKHRKTSRRYNNKTDANKFSAKRIRKSSRSDSSSHSPSSDKIEYNKKKVNNEVNTNEENSKQEDVVDPILEARRRKFETNEISKKEGVIRLKQKTNDVLETKVNIKQQVKEPEETIKDDESVIDLKVDDLFSDEESEEDENEGRFKVKSQETKRHIPILPFTQLVNGPSKNIKTTKLVQESSYKEKRKRNSQERKRLRSKSPVNRSEGNKTSSSDDKKDRVKRSNRTKMPVSTPIECKKIEIKIRNPSKYNDNVKKEKRKVEIETSKLIEEANEPEVIIDNEEEALISKNEGDLRAQLSRKRAERQSKIPLLDGGVSSRILQTALQGAVFTKIGKLKKNVETAPNDCKIPIHLRLGISDSSDIFTDTKPRKKTSRKRKNHLEQV